MKLRGFTVVELVIVIAIMAILFSLAVVNVRSTQVNARDNERHIDTENISLMFEGFYDVIDTGYFNTYPGTMLTYVYLTGSHEVNPLLSKVPPESLRAPGQDSLSLIMATNNAQSPDSVAPQPTVGTYVYQPLQGDGSLCLTRHQHCVKYNLYYKLERPTNECPAPHNICTIRSKHQ